MNSSPRNNIGVNHLMSSECVGVDTMYEIVDAEFNSRRDIHEMWNRLASSHTEFRGLFAQQLRWEVEKVAQREGLYLSRYSVEQICKRVADDWWTSK